MTPASPTPGTHLRLVWPEWQGTGTSSVRALAPEFPFDVAREALIAWLRGTGASRVAIDCDVDTLDANEFIPRQVIHLQQILAGFPLLGQGVSP
ncbi:hypothetical protein [Arthrobacter sp. NPDC056493]|uniref:hypothetical protein n=1 Tax=Arthrobacter sp. NPDC056493 TaxID=3345839 RepID=UPI0036724391